MVSWDYQIRDYRGLHVKPIAEIMSAFWIAGAVFGCPAMGGGLTPGM